MIIVHEGRKAPDKARVGVDRDGHSFWIERGDFDSKFAFSVMQNLIALAQAGHGQGAPIVTIPAY